MGNYKDLLLSVTEKYDKENRKPIKSVFDDIEVHVPEVQLSDEEENAKFLRMILEQKQGKWEFGTAFEGARDICAYQKANYLLLYYPKQLSDPAEWVLKKNGKFIFRIKKNERNEYTFKTKPDTLLCLNIDDRIQNLIKETLTIKNYCYFKLNFDDASETVGEFFTMNNSKRNDILEIL